MTSRMRITTITFCNLWRLRERWQTKLVKCSSRTQTIKSGDRTVYPKMTIILSFTHHNIKANLHGFLYSVGHKQILRIVFVCLFIYDPIDFYYMDRNVFKITFKCSAGERKSYEFGTTWEWVYLSALLCNLGSFFIYLFIFLFSLNVPDKLNSFIMTTSETS